MPVKNRSKQIFGTECFWYTAIAFGSAELGPNGEEVDYLDGIIKLSEMTKKRDGRSRYNDEDFQEED